MEIQDLQAKNVRNSGWDLVCLLRACSEGPQPRALHDDISVKETPDVELCIEMGTTNSFYSLFECRIGCSDSRVTQLPSELLKDSRLTQQHI